MELALGEYEAARSHVAEAYHLLPAAHDQLGTGCAYSLLGDLSRQQGQWAVARRYYLRAAASYKVVYNDRDLLPTKLSITEMAERLGERPASRCLRTAAPRPHCW